MDAANRFRKRVFRTVCVAAASCFLAAVDIASAQSLVRRGWEDGAQHDDGSANFDWTDLKTSLVVREKGESSRDEQSVPSTTPRKKISVLPILVAEGLIAANGGIAAGSPYGYGGTLLMLTPILGVEGCGTPCYVLGAGIGGYNLSLGRHVSPLQIFLRNEVVWHAVLGTDLLFHGLFNRPSPSYADEGGISLDFYGDDTLGEAALSVDSTWGNHSVRGRLSYLYDDDLVKEGCSVGPEYQYKLFGGTPRRLKPKIGASIARVFGCAKNEERNLAERFGGQGLVTGGAEIILRRGNTEHPDVSLNVLWYARKLFANAASGAQSVTYGVALGVTLR